MSFEENIKKWVMLDNKIKQHYEDIKKLRNEKNLLTKNLFSIAKNNNYLNSKINISDGNLKFVEMKQTAPLSLQFLNECLDEIISNKSQKNSIVDYIKNRRTHKLVSDIKRTYN
jgi:hypothetical protein